MTWVFFFAAVMLSAWCVGQGPSFAATMVLVVGGRYFFIKPYGTFTLSGVSLLPILAFIGVSLFIGFLGSARRRAEAYERAEQRRFQATVMSIGDAIIATAPAGRVTFLNGVSTALT